MKTILTIILAAIMLLSMLGGCARDMSGETRPSPTAVATTRPTATHKPTPTPKSTDSTADGVIDEGKDAVDGVVGAGEDAVNDIMDAGEDMLNDVTGNGQDNGSARDNNAQTSTNPAATPKATSKR